MAHGPTRQVGTASSRSCRTTATPSLRSPTNFVPTTLPPTPSTDLYLKSTTFLTAFANGLTAGEARVLAASQRPATLGALNEPSGVPAWRSIPSWYLIGAQDRIIPPTAEQAMAERAGATVTHFEGGHIGLIADPKSVTRVIEVACAAADGRSATPGPVSGWVAD